MAEKREESKYGGVCDTTAHDTVHLQDMRALKRFFTKCEALDSLLLREGKNKVALSQAKELLKGRQGNFKALAEVATRMEAFIDQQILSLRKKGKAG